MPINPSITGGRRGNTPFPPFPSPPPPPPEVPSRPFWIPLRGAQRCPFSLSAIGAVYNPFSSAASKVLAHRLAAEFVANALSFGMTELVYSQPFKSPYYPKSVLWSPRCAPGAEAHRTPGFVSTLRSAPKPKPSLSYFLYRRTHVHHSFTHSRSLRFVTNSYCSMYIIIRVPPVSRRRQQRVPWPVFAGFRGFIHNYVFLPACLATIVSHSSD